MAVLHVNPTRMELTRLKKRLSTSFRGHKLLKDKRDDLMKKFLELAGENLKLRAELEDKMQEVYAGFATAAAYMGEASLREALMLPQNRVTADVKVRKLMSVSVPDFEFSGAAGVSKGRYPYGFAFTSGALDDSVDALNDVVPLMLRLAGIEKTVQLLAEETEKTRRRVNALEHVQIPALQETVKSITMRMSENERSNLARLMKVKDMMTARRRRDIRK